MSSNKTGFRQGRLGIGKEPIFPLDISGSMRIEGDLVLAGTIADIQGNPIEFGASSATFNMSKTFPDPTIAITEFPDWSNNVVVEGAGKFLDGATSGDIYYNGGNVGIGYNDPGTYKLKVNGKGYFSQIDLPGGDIQAQINEKQIKLSSTVRLNASYIGDNDDVSNTEYGYLNGVTSSIQTQLNGKLGSTSRATSAAKVFLNHGVSTNSNHSVCTANIGGNGDYLIYTHSHFCFNTNSGNVGIGTTTPQTKLDVAGDYSKDGEIISMSCQYGLNAKASIFNDWFREEHSNWGLYWINNVTYNSLDYSTLVPYARTTDDGDTGYVSTGVTGKSISSLMTAYSPGDRGERIGSTCKDLGTYTHHTFAIHFGYWSNGIASTYIRYDDDPWECLPDTSVGSGTSVDIMFTGYIKCNETNTYYFAIHSFDIYNALLFIQKPNEGTGTMWGFGQGGTHYWSSGWRHMIRTDGISMTAGKYYKIAFCTKGSGRYYYAGAGIQLGWTKDGTFSTSNYYSSSSNPMSRLYSTYDIDGKTNWECRFGWISDDSPLQFVKRIPN